MAPPSAIGQLPNWHTMLRYPLRQKLVQAFPDPRISGWQSVASLIEFFSYYSGHAWLFRGITNASYCLAPKVGRPDRKRLPDGSGNRVPYSLKDERAVLAAFKSYARPLVANAPTTTLEWLGLAQHFGVPTRLLDWTTGLLAAIWFATNKSGFATAIDVGTGRVVQLPVDGAVWVAWNLPDVTERDHQAPFAVKGVRKYRPEHYTPRINAQQSIFTIQAKPQEELSGDNFFKFTIPSEECFTIRKRLDACGISERTIYPDLVGLGGDLAWRYKNNYLAGFKSEEMSVATGQRRR